MVSTLQDYSAVSQSSLDLSAVHEYNDGRICDVIGGLTLPTNPFSINLTITDAKCSRKNEVSR